MITKNTKKSVFVQSIMLLMILFTVTVFPASGQQQERDSMITENFQEIKSFYDIPVSIQVEKASLNEIFSQLEKQMGLRFLYNPKVIEKSEHRLDLDFTDVSVADVLTDVALQTGLTFRQVNGAISIGVDKFRAPATETEMLEVVQQMVTGTVVDAETGEALPGVNVIVAGSQEATGSTIGTTTNMDGQYEIQVPDDLNTLAFTFVGYQRTEVQIDGRTEVNIELASDVQMLEDVVVVGYGTQRLSDLTGSVSRVSTEQLNLSTYENAVESLQGKLAGVVVQSTNADPGGDSFRIRVRGTTSVNASSDPLFVVDGMVDGTQPRPEDIESVEVLKDASATAIYGSRGSNGVVLITTKSGEAGSMEVNYNSSFSSQEEIGRLDVLNARQFVEYINEARGTDFFDINDIETDTDWQNHIFQRGYTQNHQLSVSGGSERVQYYLSGGFFDQKGLIKNSAYENYTLKANFNIDLSDRVRLRFTSNYQNGSRDGVLTQTGGGVTNSGAVTSALRFDPNRGIIDRNGDHTKSRVGIAAFENPDAVINGRDEENLRESFQGDLKAEFDIVEGMIFNSFIGITSRNQRTGVFNKTFSNLGEQRNGLGIMNMSKNLNFLTEQYLNFDFSVGKRNNFILTGGASYQYFESEGFSAQSEDFISDAIGFFNLGAGNRTQPPSSNYRSSEIASLYGRFNYNFDDRYLITGTGRLDGASQFSEGNKWSFFPSGAFSWNVNNEKFYPTNDILSGLKLRVSYGRSGNQAIGPFQSLARLTTTLFVQDGSSLSSIRPSTISNRDLTWETTNQFNAGLDLEFFDGRISFTGDFYNKQTSDLLFQVPIPSFSGFRNRLANVGDIENKGLEFEFRSINLVGNVNWTTNLSATFNRNKVVSLPGGNDIIIATVPGFTGSVTNSILREGKPLGSFYGFVYEGVYQAGDEFIPGGAFEQEPGGEKFADLNNDGVLDNNDRKIIGDPNPDAVLGLINDFSFRGFNVNIFFQAFLGGDMLNLVKQDLDRLSGNTNATTDALNRWTPENTNTDVPKATAGRVPRTSTRFVEDGSFIRLENISIGYDLPTDFINRLGLNSVRLSIRGRKLLTFTNYSGVDPEVAFRSSNTNLGLDFGSYPNAKSYTFGLNLGF